MGDKQYGGSCKDAKKAFEIETECCRSCHIQREDSFYQTGVPDPFTVEETEDKWFEVCCSVAEAIHNK